MKDLLLIQSPTDQPLDSLLRPSQRVVTKTLHDFIKSDLAYDQRQILPPEFYDYSGHRTGYGTWVIRGINSKKTPYITFPGIRSAILPPTSLLLRGVRQEVLKIVTTPVRTFFREGNPPPKEMSIESGGKPVGQAKTYKRGLILLHGWNGNGQDTWKNFPELLTHDFPLDKVALYNYPTSKWGTIRGSDPTPADIAEAFRNYLETQFDNCENVVILAHSLGGVIARKYLVEEIKQGRSAGLRVRAMILYGSPFDGSEWDRVTRFLAATKSQAAHVQADSAFLLELQKDWSRYVACLDWDIGEASQLAVPTYAMVGVKDTTVSDLSASFYSNRVRKVMKDHQGLVKPQDKNDEVYVTTKAFLQMIVKDLAKPRTNKTCV